jgi:predicted acetyltransferase
VRLRPLQLEDEAEACAAHRELSAEGFSFLLDWDPEQPWAQYLKRLEHLRRGGDVPADRVPATFLAAYVGADLIGRVSIRHTLNSYLADVGGHIGYGVRAAHRGCGYATEILRQALIIARTEGVDRALVTCDADNPASAAVITKLGGRLEAVREDRDGTRRLRYWID